VTSAQKIAANRQNATKSTGPRTSQGKSRSSGNALRHGFDAAYFGHQELSEKVNRIAKELCKDDTDPFRFEQAIIIAESQILIARVRAARIAAIERVRNSAGPGRLTLPGCLTTEELENFSRDLQDGNIRRAVKLINRNTREFKAFVKALLASMNAETEDLHREARREVDRMIMARFEETNRSAPEEREDAACVRRALPDLLSLERYEKRALSRRKRAIRRFDQLGDK
jgi:hypothetical protein